MKIGWKLWEKYYPAFFGVLTGFMVWWLFKARAIPEKIYDMMANGINIGGIIVGFLATTIALIYSLQNNFIITQLKKMGHFETFLSHFQDTVRWCMVLAGLGAVSFFLDFKDVNLAAYNRIFLALWVCVFITAGLCAYRFIRVLCILLHSEAGEK